MKKTKLLAGAVLSLLGGVAMTSIASATTPVTVESNGDLTVCGTEYVSDSNGAQGCITIQGKNLGATTTGAGPNAPVTSYGNYYQWGNNYGFSDNIISQDGVINCSIYNPLNPFSSSVFLTNNDGNEYDYCYPTNNNMWGGGSDNNGLVYPVTNESERRGPCDEGYHVPGLGEWEALIDMWAGYKSNGSIYEGGLQFSIDFQIPFAGFISAYYPRLFNTGDDFYIWSSNSSEVYIDDYGISSSMDYHSNGFSVRCFKNSSVASPSSEDGGDSLITVNIAALNGGQNTCTLDNYIFSGIFASPSVVFRNISQSMHCIFGNANGSVVTLQLSGDLTDGSGNTIPAGNVRLKNTAWTATPAAVQGASSAIGDYTSLNQTLTLFNKVANKIGEATGSAVDIQVEIPGGTPDGVYNGTLVLSY